MTTLLRSDNSHITFQDDTSLLEFLRDELEWVDLSNHIRIAPDVYLELLPSGKWYYNEEFPPQWFPLEGTLCSIFHSIASGSHPYLVSRFRMHDKGLDSYTYKLL